MSASRDAVEHLADMIAAGSKAREFLGSMSLAEFAADERTVYAVVRALEILGEATKRIPQPIRDCYPTVPWRAMAGIRDKLIHDYINVNPEIVWRTIVEDLPDLLPQLEAALAGEQGDRAKPTDCG
jgi:uncharacterized protein with HEPN domain